MKQLLFILPLSILASIMPAGAQITTQIFKPGPSIGEDAYLMELDGNCVPTGESQTPADVPHGNNPDMSMSAWTWYAAGCTTGTIRGLIRFTQLSTIPPSANIISATLRLRTPSTMPGYSNWGGNSYYQGSPNPTNPGTLYRVSPGTVYNWNEMAVTWNQFVPLSGNTVPGSAVAIPASSAQYNTILDINVTNIVQNIVTELGSNPYANNGFYLMLNTEVHYRAQGWATSDYPDSTFWPELIIRYTNCDPSFTYCASTNDPYTYNFTANSPNQISYNWVINGTSAGNASSLSYTFPGPGSYQVCLYTASQSDKCDYCMKLCINENKPSQKPALIPEGTEQLKAVHQGATLPGDDVRAMSDREGIMPNPSNTGWNLKFNASEAGKVSVHVIDPTGRKISSAEKKVSKGEQVIYQDAAKLDPGIYFIEIKGAGVQFREKAVKN